MARFLGDQNKVVGVSESGTYASRLGAEGAGSVFWVGQVMNHSFDSDEGFIENRFMGTSTRNFDRFDNGPRNYTGTLEYAPQDMRLVFMSIGSIFSESGTQSTHTATEINSDVRQSPFTSGTLNPPISFTLEDSKQSPGTGRNFVRTIQGVVPNTTTVSLTQGEKVSVSMDYIAQSQVASSGATTTVSEITTAPYLWSSAKLSVGVGANIGSILTTAKEIELIINQNRTGPHYLDSSREISVPFNGNRDYTLNVTMDLDGQESDMLYNNFFRDGNKFHAELDLNADITATGSQHATFIMSGCRIVTMANPSENEGLTETTLEIRPESLSATEYNNSIVSGIYTPF